MSSGKKSLPEIEQLLLDDPLSLVSLFTFFNTNDLDRLGEAIGLIFLVNNRSPDLLTLCATQEIYSTARAEQLFRQDSIFIVILQHFVKKRGLRWLYNTLRKPLRKLIQADYSIEIDKMRLSANEDLSTNKNYLEASIRQVLDPIFDNPESFPPEIAALCKVLFQITNEKFPGEGYKVLSGSLFLRFICPFIGSPKSWHLLTRNEIDNETKRKLILVAKVVQGIANEITEFNESYMNIISDLLVEYIGKLHQFYDRLIQISPPISQINCRDSKEKRTQLIASQQIIAEFFKDNIINILREVVQPLAPNFTGAEIFGKRLELLFYEDLEADNNLSYVNIKNRVAIQKEVYDCLKDLRKNQNHSVWEYLLDHLQTCVAYYFLLPNLLPSPPFPHSNFDNRSHSNTFSGCGFLNLQFINIPKKLYNIDNEHQEKPRHRASTMSLLRLGRRRKDSPIENAIASEINNPISTTPELKKGYSFTYMNSASPRKESEKVEDEAIYATIKKWLQSLGHEELLGLFIVARVDVAQLKKFKDQDFIKIGIQQKEVRETLGLALFSEILNDGENFASRKKKQVKKPRKVNSKSSKSMRHSAGFTPEETNNNKAGGPPINNNSENS